MKRIEKAGARFDEKDEDFEKIVNASVSRFKSRQSLAHQDRKILNMVRRRNNIQILYNGRNVTPKNLVELGVDEDFKVPFDAKQLWSEYSDNDKQQSIHSERESMMSDLRRSSSMVPDVETIIKEIQSTSDECTDLEIEKEHVNFDFKMPSFIKIILEETDVIVFYEQPSVTVIKGSDEAAIVEEDNAAYEYLTSEKGLNRRRAEAETQTSDTLVKSRSTNTDKINRYNVATFVSNYDMYDTYKDLERFIKTVQVDGENNMDIATYAVGDADNHLFDNKQFLLSSMVIERLLAGNVFETKQKRFRNMYPPDPLDISAKLLYRIEVMWTYKMRDTMGKAVSCASWCESNGDVLAVSYGIYNFIPWSQRRDGYVCIWNMKNPVNPERRYRYHIPVTTIAFSKKNPQLLAIGLYNGTIEVRDVMVESDESLIAKSHRSTSPGFEPVWDIQWIPGDDLFGINEQLLTISQDGRVMKYSFITGLFLLGFQQLLLNRVDGVVEGLQIVKKKDFIEANRHPNAMFLQMHPTKTDDYFVGTDEGCLHRSSINFPAQHKMQVHNGRVHCLEFSPWSPKIFLTCGSDWYIRIWIEGLFVPICELSSGIGSVQYAYWSPTHPSIFACINKYHVEIWDLKRKTLKPASVHKFGAANQPLTIMKFSRDGRTMIVADEEGVTHVCALEDMPFPPHYPYLDLQATLYKLMDANPDLLNQVKNLGYLGY